MMDPPELSFTSVLFGQASKIEVALTFITIIIIIVKNPIPLRDYRVIDGNFGFVQIVCLGIVTVIRIVLLIVIILWLSWGMPSSMTALSSIVILTTVRAALSLWVSLPWILGLCLITNSLECNSGFVISAPPGPTIERMVHLFPHLQHF